MTHPNANLIRSFYTSFQARDAAGMAACYHADITFSDPVFGRLRGREAAAMWRMLCARADGLMLTFSDVRAEAGSGSARWEAHYAFGRARRPVHNVIEAAFVFRDGLIETHTDSFDLRRWARMALGTAGLLFGWTPMMQAAIRRSARRSLAAYLRQETAAS